MTRQQTDRGKPRLEGHLRIGGASGQIAPARYNEPVQQLCERQGDGAVPPCPISPKVWPAWSWPSNVMVARHELRCR